MDAKRQKEIASKGGRAAHEKGTAHEWSADEARAAGRKGGVAVSRDRAHMSAIGREGGESRSAAIRQSKRGEKSEREVLMHVIDDLRAASSSSHSNSRPISSDRTGSGARSGEDRPRV